MASDEISEKNVEAVTEANLRRWMQVVACMIVTAGVCWCENKRAISSTPHATA